MHLTKQLHKLYTKIKHRFLATEGFVLFAASIIIVVALISSILGYTIFRSYHASIQKELRLASIGINNILDEIFTESNRLMVYIEKQIVHSGGRDLKTIEELLMDTSGQEYKAKALIYWKTVFDWVSPNYFQLVTSLNGVMNTPSDVSHRSYCRKTRYNPWSIQFSKPDIGVSSGVWVIPAGTGITNGRGDFLGIISMGFNIAKLSSILSERLAGEKVSFLVLDDELNIVLQSPDNLVLQSKTNDLKQAIKKISGTITKDEAILATPLIHNNILYNFYKKMDGYPFVILTGIQNNHYRHGLYTTVLPPIIELIGLGTFSLILLYISRSRILKMNQNSDKAMKEFIAKVNQKLHLQLDVILQYSLSLIRYHKGEIKVGINPERQLEFITHINNAALNIKNLSNYNLDLTPVDIHSAIKDTVYIHTRLAYQKDITIKTDLESKSPYIEADDFCIRQILMSLLSSSIEYTPTGGTIWISTSSMLVGDQNKITITILDNGFGLNEEDRLRIRSKFNTQNLGDYQIATDLDMADIQKLVHQHQGVCETRYIEGKGRAVKIHFHCAVNSL